MKSFIVCLTLLAACAPTAFADVEPAGIFGDHMVLQRDTPIRVWGRAEPGEKVTVKLGSRSASATTLADGTWRVELPTMSAGGPHKMTIKGNAAVTIRYDDVLIGEVWLCSGQSNMEWTVTASADAKAEIKAAKDKKIRHMKVAHRPAGAPLDQLSARWEVCGPKTAGRFTACGYFMARALRKKLKVPIGLINTSWGGTRIEPWIAPDAFAPIPSLAHIGEQVAANAGKKPANHQQPSVLFNGMVHALVGFPIRGAIWYQGESNHTEGMLYADKKQALIDGWRRLWGIGDFPFHYVQIAPFRYGNEAPEVLATFWEAQAAVLERVANTGMVVINDIATLDNIHPPNKQDVGERLARLALNRAYDVPTLDSGPILREMAIANGSLRLVFDHIGTGLKSRDRKPLTHFEIAGATTGFVPADAKIEGNTIVLTARAVADPVAMRFAWHKLAQPNLVNSAGLPAGAFRAGEIPKPDFLAEIGEASGYALLYDLDLADLSTAPKYLVDECANVTGEIERVAYLLELQSGSGGAGQYMWVSMDAFTQKAAELGVPSVSAGFTHQQRVSGLTIQSNAKGLATGTGLEGNVEFWPNNYGPGNSAGIPGASAKVYDIGDQPAGAPSGYGSMQIHNTKAKQTLIAINHWSVGGAGADIGIGNSDKNERAKDWTFSANGGSYLHKRLRVFVKLK